MKYCKDCEHYRDVRLCQAPENGIDVVTGEVKILIASRRRMAMADNCGPDARWFKPKKPILPLLKKHWWKFWTKGEQS